MTLICPSLRTLAGMAAVALTLGCGSSQAADAKPFAGNDVREFRIGMPIAELPTEGYTGFACADAPERTLQSWADFGACPADERGLHAVTFQYDDATNPRAALDDKYEGTKIGGHPVLLTLLIGDDQQVDGLVIETDPKSRLYLKKKAFLLGNQIKSRYGEEGWDCRSEPPAGDEEPVGETFIKERCEKTSGERRLILERALFRHSGQELKNFVGKTKLTILHAG